MMELAGEISNRHQSVQLEYLGTKTQLAALWTPTASQTESYQYIRISFGLAFFNAREPSASVGLRHMRKAIHMHKYLQVSFSVCSQIKFFSIVVNVNK